MDKTISRVTNLEEQQMETYRYWQERPLGERLIAVSEVSQAAYAFAAAFKGARANDEQGLSRHFARIPRAQS
jgi:hypothetical protein